MLSLPLIPPQASHHTSLRPVSPPPPPSTQANANNPQLHRQQRQQRDDEKRLQHARSPLALLAADEAAIAARKAAIRNFGAYWIRPPGIPKTLQAMNEEEIERREQEELERQERGMADLQARQQQEELRQQAAEGEEMGGEGAERDLDDEIPDADADAHDEDEEDLDAGETTGDVTFNEDSMLEGSLAEQQEYAEMEEAELTGAARDEEDLGIERDLDDDVPEAGSYQHTDTELEDSSSSDENESSEVQDSFAQQSARRSARVSQMRQNAAAAMTPPAGMGGLQERMRAQVAGADSLPRSPGSLNLSSSILESSFVGSSPMMQRGARGRGGAAARRRGRMS